MIAAALAIQLVACTVLPGQETFTCAPQWKMGEKANFKIAMDITSSNGEASVKMQVGQTVLKTYDGGEADVETQVQSLAVLLNGQEVNSAHSGGMKQVARVNRFGIPLAAKTEGEAGDRLSGLVLLLLAAPIAQEMKVGTPSPVTHKDTRTGKVLVKGVATLEAIRDGVATIVSNLEVFAAEGSEPSKLAVTSLVRTTDSKTIKATGTLSNVDVGFGDRLTAIQYVVERVQSESNRGIRNGS